MGNKIYYDCSPCNKNKITDDLREFCFLEQIFFVFQLSAAIFGTNRRDNINYTDTHTAIYIYNIYIK
jgi:hypothetical protein